MSPDYPQHVIQRGNNRQAVFFADEDYIFYLDRLKHYAKQYNVVVHAFIKSITLCPIWTYFVKVNN